MGKPKRIKVTTEEDALWRDRLAVLQAGIKQGRQGTKRQAESQLKQANQRLGNWNRRRAAAASRAQELKATLEMVKGEVAKLEREIHRIGTVEITLAKAIASEAPRAAELKALVNSYKTPATPDDNQPTPEQLARPSRKDPLDALQASGDLTHEQVMAGYKLRQISEAISRAGQAKVSRLEGGGGGGTWKEPGLPDSIVDIYHHVFLPWIAKVGSKSDEAFFAEKVAIRGIRLRVAARHKHMGDDAAVKLLQEALTAFHALWRATRSRLEPVHDLPPVGMAS